MICLGLTCFDVKGVFRETGGHDPSGHTLIAGNILLHVTLVIYYCICLIGTFSDHEGKTYKTMMTKKVIKILGNLLHTPSNQKFRVRRCSICCISPLPRVSYYKMHFRMYQLRPRHTRRQCRLTLLLSFGGWHKIRTDNPHQQKVNNQTNIRCFYIMCQVYDSDRKWPCRHCWHESSVSADCGQNNVNMTTDCRAVWHGPYTCEKARK